MRAWLLTSLTLCLAACSWAQPWGPYEITATSDSLQNLRTPQIAIIDSQTARVFYTLDLPGLSEIRTVLYDLANHQLIGTPELARSDSVSQQLLDGAVDGPNAWVVVYNRRFDATWVDTKYLAGPAPSGYEGYMGTTGWPNSPRFPNYDLSDFDLVSRVGGGWVLTWVQVMFPPPWYEDGSHIYVAGLNADSMVYCHDIVPIEYELFGPYVASTVSLTPDSSLLLTEQFWHPNWPEALSTLVHAVAGADSEILDTICTYDCDINPLSFRRAANGTFLAYSDPNSLYRVNETGECEVLGSLSNGYRPTDLDFQAAYGFASIWVNSNWIQLGRMHVDGTMVELGVFYWWDGEHAIRDASVAIAPDGRIYVVWTERSSDETRLMIARINWDTPLEARDRDFVLPPSSFILSAYPNPFNSTLKIEYTLPRAGDVEVSVYNVLGQKVETVLDARVESGTHAVTWNPGCAGGVYFVTMKTETAARTTKVLYLR
ncbi:MAG: T9SS type A sorting domain-containing protein [bacterium]|nr:T9SS type A sorting domain-containing protein [bacterium]